MRYFESLRPRWLDLAWLFFMFLPFLDRDEVEVIKSFKNRARQISSYLDWQAWTIKDSYMNAWPREFFIVGQNRAVRIAPSYPVAESVI